jgi:hypothetical protein
MNVEVEGSGKETIMTDWLSLQSCNDNLQEEDGVAFDEMGR